jgi:membrane-associated phospholipid phosphatase
MKRFTTLVARALTCVACAGAAPEPAAPHLAATVVVDWNQRVLAVAEAEDGFLTLKGVRTATMMHLAIHDALNAIDRRYETYLPSPGAAGGDPLAAAAQAAHDVALHEYPGQAAAFDAELDRWLAGVEDETERARGVDTGRAAAASILAARQGDGWDSEAEYHWHPMGPGVYAEFAEHSGTPKGFVFGAGWATAKPFALEGPGQFRSPPPPAIASAAYTVAFREVKEVGRDESTTRTADQTHLAMWWKDFAENSHNRLARQLVTGEGLELWRAARLFALLDMGIYDGYVSVFENKFLYNHWRPYTAIRWAANDGNPDTEADPAWDNLHHHTYAFPSYPSAHGTVCAAAATVLADTFGEGYAFTMTTSQVDAAGPMSGKIPMEPPTRSFSSFSAAAMECAMSRVYLGIHFRYDSVAGNDLGREIGRYALETILRPLPEAARR